MTDLPFWSISAVAVVLLLILFPAKGQVLTQTVESVTALPCNTWGTPNWKKLETHLRNRGIVATGARFREYDDNIDDLAGHRFLTCQDEIYLRWLLKDTTIFYDIKIRNAKDELVFETTSNACGLKLPVDFLIGDSDGISISVERNKDYNGGGFNWGTGFSITRLALEERQIVLKLMPYYQQQLTDIQSRTALVRYLLRNFLPLDALTVLEYYVEKNGQDEAAINQYWEIVNDLRIKGFK